MKSINSPMAGTLMKVVMAVGDVVDFGDTVAILESMKMEIPVEADRTGTISKILVQEGEVVDEGTPLVELA
ncbi:MAG: acetyl-CoA carboxylase biotin carboxyl carrier protein subunit [Janthinobacterium lividum]